MMNMGYLNARWVLGWALIKHILLRPFVRRDPSLWVKRIAQESLGPTPPSGWSLFENTSRCIGCGLCDAVVPAGVLASTWIHGSIRHPHDAPLALAQAQLLRKYASAIDRVCPARVKAASVADLIEAQASMIAHTPAKVTFLP